MFMFTLTEKMILAMTATIALSACGQVQRFPYVPSGTAPLATTNTNKAPQVTPPAEGTGSQANAFVDNAQTPEQTITTEARFAALDKSVNAATGLNRPELTGPIPSPLVIATDETQESSQKPPSVQAPATPVSEGPVTPLTSETAPPPTSSTNMTCGELGEKAKACVGDRVLYYDKKNQRLILGSIESFAKKQISIKLDRQNALMASLLNASNVNSREGSSIPDVSMVKADDAHPILVDGFNGLKNGHVVAYTIAKGQRVAGEIDEIFEGGYATIRVNPLLGVGSKVSSLYLIDLKKASKQAPAYGKFKVDDRVHYTWGDRFFNLDKSRRLEIVGRIAEIFEDGQMIIDVDPTLLNGAQVYRLFWIDPGPMALKVNELKGFKVGDSVNYVFTKGQKFTVTGKITELFESGRAFIEVDPNVGDGAKVFHLFGADIKAMTHSK